MNKVKQEIIDKTIEAMLDDDIVLDAITESYTPIELYGESLVAECASSAFAPDDIFDRQVLVEWFLDNNDIDDHLDWDTVLDKISLDYTPEDLWSGEWIENWAREEYGNWIIAKYIDDTPVGQAYHEDELLEWMEDYLKENNLKIVEDNESE